MQNGENSRKSPNTERNHHGDRRKTCQTTLTDRGLLAIHRSTSAICLRSPVRKTLAARSLSANVFPSAGVSAVFSNVVNHSIVVRRMTVAGLGEAAKFKPGDQEYRFNCKFTALERGADGSKPVQKGTCTFPGGQELTFVVNDEKGASTPDGVFRVFAGLRSDPFYLAWLVAVLKKFPNLLQHDNVLSIVIDFDTKRVLEPDKGPLFGVIAETSAIPQPRSLIGHEPPRFDWVGRPEQTNMRLNNPAMAGTDDVRDLWNQMTPFALAEEFQPDLSQTSVGQSDELGYA